MSDPATAPRVKLTRRRIRTNGVTIQCATAGDGLPLLMLHGYPQTHVMWHLVAPVLGIGGSTARPRPMRLPVRRICPQGAAPEKGAFEFPIARR